jgi:RHH-type proline utilization regulon transcriptional repressor/proline dehydrogenase/delta 1-pyrroline-5-carboxylate dehydrogenase
MTDSDEAKPAAGTAASNERTQLLWRDIDAHFLRPEDDCLTALLDLVDTRHAHVRQVEIDTLHLVDDIRHSKSNQLTLEAFLQEYRLDSEEGATLMCLAEALLRIPDRAVAQQLAEDKLKIADWRKHIGRSESFVVNASTWALMVSRNVISGATTSRDNPTRLGDLLQTLTSKYTEPVILAGLKQAMRLIAGQFVFGQSIDNAIKRANDSEEASVAYSFDMLGEAALTREDALRYYQAYFDAISRIARRNAGGLDASISIKLSALHPRYEALQEKRILKELGYALRTLIEHARSLDVAVTIDAEESYRLLPSLRLFDELLQQEFCNEWSGLGLAVQAYSKRALPTLRWLQHRAQTLKRRIPVRLVKGAYWDTEIKLAQQLGYEDYPVFTRKALTDVSYLACASYMLDNPSQFLPQFATHNAHTVISILDRYPQGSYEFQRLHGMGELLYQQVHERYPQRRCRIYAPVGKHRDLLPYLVRRLLENGASTSFVHKLIDEDVPAAELAVHPTRQLRQQLRNLPLPGELFGAQRKNSAGTPLCDEQTRGQLEEIRNMLAKEQYFAYPLIAGKNSEEDNLHIHAPHDPAQIVGRCFISSEDDVRLAISSAQDAFMRWRATAVEERCNALRCFSDMLDAQRMQLAVLCSSESGKTLPDSLDDIREAVDFARYYAYQAQSLFHGSQPLHGPTGEINTLHWQGKGVIAAISPWNFPVAIFCGQICAALAAGNCVLAKPAETTPLIAYQLIKLLHKSGIPEDVLHFIPGEGARIGKILCRDERVCGIAFTGSTRTAKTIQRALAERDGAIATLVAETGGQNVMLADSSAHHEQLVRDVIRSAFNSAGQRCSALRVLYLQEEIHDTVLELLKGAMAQLAVGDPLDLATDVGPVINRDAKQKLDAYIAQHRERVIYQTDISQALRTQGHFVAPTVIAIDGINDMGDEVFGPILHVARFRYDQLENVIADVNRCPFGLTFGIHTRNDVLAMQVASMLHVGNIYINRNMVGAVVGVQPFGGMGLSGTGPKAGGPHYLQRFANEVAISNNIAAVGGNAKLLAQN